MTGSSSLIDQLTATADDPERTILLRGATVVTMDPTTGTLAPGDVLIVGNSIAEIGADLGARATSVDITIDLQGSIVAPGMVDTHRHSWQAPLRRTIPDVENLTDYLVSTLWQVAPVYTPDDMFVGNRLAALTALDGGITTMLDFSHNSRSQAHSDAAIQGLISTGIRGVHASMGPHFGSWDGQWPADLKRIRSTWFSSDDQLCTLRLAALATPEIAGPHVAYGPDLARVATELDLGVSVDAVFGQAASDTLVAWEKDGLLGPRLTAIHATSLSAEAWAALGRSGTTVSLAPTSDTQIGLYDAVPPVDEALASGIRPGLSIDVEVALVSDMFTQMRTLLSVQRMLAVNRVYGTDEAPVRITTRDVFDFATLQGARTNGLAEITGSLTAGKQADLIVVDAEDLNNMPLNDPMGTLVLGSDRSNITSVWVAGQVRKWDGQLLGVDLDRLRSEVQASRDGVLERVAASSAHIG